MRRPAGLIGGFVGSVLLLAGAAWWWLWPDAGDVAPVPATRDRVQPAPADPDAQPAGSPAAPAAERAPSVPEGLRRVRGRVLLAGEERPVAGARVRASPVLPSLAGSELFLMLDELGGAGYRRRIQEAFGEHGGLAEDWTDAGGDFELTVEEDDPFFVVVQSPEGYQSEYPEVKAGSGADGLLVWLTPGALLWGRVVDPEGEGLAGARLELMSPVSPMVVLAGEVRDFRVWLTTSGVDGAFRFEALPRDRPYSLFVSRPGYARGVVDGIELRDEDPPPRTIVLRRGAALTGRVQTFEGAAVAGAEVVAVPMTSLFQSILEAERRHFETRSGPDGRFAVDDVPAGRWRIYARAPGFVTTVLRGVDVTEAGGPGVVITLERGLAIRGTVVDDAGAPVPGARIRAYRQRTPGIVDLSDTSVDLVLRNETHSGDDGAFVLEGLAEGPWNLEVRGDAHGRTTVLGVAAGSEVVLHVERLGGITGIVISSATGRPVPRFRVTARRGFLGDREEDLADPEGRFHLEGLAAGTYQVQIEAEDHARAFLPEVAVFPGAVTEGLVAILGEGVTLRGRVVDGATREGVQGAEVRTDQRLTLDRRSVDQDLRLFGVSLDRIPPLPVGSSADLVQFLDEFATSRTVRTDPRGEFELRGLPRAAVTLTVRHSAYRELREELSLERATESEELELALEAGAGIVGTVALESGTPVVGALVFARGGASRRLRHAMTGETGEYRLLGLEAGLWSLFLIDADVSQDSDSFLAQLFARMKPALLTVRDGQEVRHDIVLKDVVLEGTTVRGTVSSGGVLLDAGTLTAVPEGSSGGLWGGGARGAQVHEDGTYVLAGVRPGRQHLRYTSTQMQNYGVDLGSFDIPDQAEYFLPLELPGGSVRGQVVDAGSGQPLARARLRLASGDAARRSVTDAGGLFAFDLVAAGHYRLEVVPGEAPTAMEFYALAEFELADGEVLELGTLELGVDAGGGLSVLVVVEEADGSEAHGVTVILRDASGSAVHVAGDGPVFAGLFPERDPFVLHGVRPGTWTVEVWRGGERAAAEERRLAADSTELRIRVASPER